MKYISRISQVFIYIVSIFGVIDIMIEKIKPTAEAILLAFVLLAFGTQLLYKKRLLVIDIMILIFALISSLGFSVFVSDLIFHPIAIAIDCEGHKPSRTHFIDIMLVGLFVTFVLGLVFLKSHKQKNSIDHISSFIIIPLLLLCYTGTDFFENLKRSIDAVSTPKLILPDGC